MKINMKKLVSVVTIFGLVTSQIACAGKVTKISAPLDQVKFDKDYKYSVNLKSGEFIKATEGDKIQGTSDQLILKTQSTEQSFSNKDVVVINGTSTKRNGSYAKRGLAIGAGMGFALGVFEGVTILGGLSQFGCEGHPECESPSALQYSVAALIGGTVWGCIGSLFGLGIGALLPKYNKVQITPVISPTTSGVDTGVNVGVTF